jgi:hypothetical protein
MYNPARGKTLGVLNSAQCLSENNHDKNKIQATFSWSWQADRTRERTKKQPEGNRL